MNEFRKRFNRFCLKNRNKGIPNLMMYIAIGSVIIALLSTIDPSNALYYILCFDRTSILRGQIWRLFTYPLCYSGGSILMTIITLFCYYTLGNAIENVWGTFRFNLFYFLGILLMDIYCMIFGGVASAYYLNMSLFLAYATMYPDAQFLFFFIIPVKAWIFGLLDLVIVLMGLIGNPFPYNFFPVIALANYFIFFGKDVKNLIPMQWRVRSRNAAKSATRAKTIPFDANYTRKETPPYRHKCMICGKTDISHPQLEFRYCSRCKGYYCYCQDHIGNHTHIQ